MPLPAAAAPVSCGQALRYAAQSGAGLLRINSLDPSAAGRTDAPLKDVSVGDTRTALVAQSPINAAALARLLDDGPAGRTALADVLRRTAPPTPTIPKQRAHGATRVGPVSLGRAS